MATEEEILNNKKNVIEVVIGGKSFKLSGDQPGANLQRVADYLNRINAEYEQTEGYSKLPYDQRGLLVQLNIADDYFKALDKAAATQKNTQGKDKEIYDIKHELVTCQMKVESLTKALVETQKELKLSKEKITQLERRLSARK